MKGYITFGHQLGQESELATIEIRQFSVFRLLDDQDVPSVVSAICCRRGMWQRARSRVVDLARPTATSLRR